MTKRCIPLDSCAQCPHRHHGGGFAKVSYVPKCRKANRELPHSIAQQRGHLTASTDFTIPDWCPLPEFKEDSDD